MNSWLDHSDPEALIRDLEQILAERFGASIATLSDDQINSYLELLLNTRSECEEQAPVHTLFEARAAAMPDATAVVLHRWPAGGALRARVVTYGELNSCAGRMARALREEGIGPGNVVGLHLNRSLELVTGVLALLKIGAPFVLLPPEYPREVIDRIIRVSDPALIVVPGRSAGVPAGVERPVFPFEYDDRGAAGDPADGDPAGVDPDPGVDASGLAYFTFTPTTGVMVENRSVRRRVLWFRDSLPLAEGEAVFHRSVVGADAVVREVLWPLVSGAAVVIAPAGAETDARYIRQAIAEEAIRVAHFTPSELATVVGASEADAVRYLDGLRQALCSGSPLPPRLVERFHECSCAELWHLYAPPEAGGEAAAHLCAREERVWRVPIGSPIAGLSLYVLDSCLQPVPVGVTGNVYVSGGSLARGYRGESDVEAQVILDDPFAGRDDVRMVATGQPGRRIDEDTIELMPGGTRLLLEGCSIAPGEIEGIILRDRSIEDCAVAVRIGSNDAPCLVAYVVPGASFHPDRLLHRLRTALPPELLPTAVVPVASIPLNRSGHPDESILFQVPAIDPDCVSRWEERLRSVPGIDAAAVVARIQIGARGGVTKEIEPRNGFHHVVWKRRAHRSAGRRRGAERVLILADERGLGAAIAEALARQGDDIIMVTAGDRFERIEPGKYRIDPSVAGHYRELLERECVNGRRIDRVLHCWTYGREACRQLDAGALGRGDAAGAGAMLLLLKALADVRPEGHDVSLHIVSDGAQQVRDSDTPIPERALLLGLARTLPREMPWLDVRHLDLSPDDLQRNPGHVLAELEAPRTEREVACRAGSRFVPRLAFLRTDEGFVAGEPIVHNGCYVISGGLGAVGVELARWLLVRRGARLIILGRTPLPDPRSEEEWSEFEPDPSARGAALRSLHELPGDVAYVAVDICDEDAVAAAVEARAAAWGCAVDGAFHLAGEFRERLLIDETPESFAQGCRARALGVIALDRALARWPKSFLVAFSSANAFFGAATAGAYVAANAFVESYLLLARTAREADRRSIAWTAWDVPGNSGSARMVDQLSARGLGVIDRDHGIESVATAMCSAQPRLMAGLDGTHPFIRRHAEEDEPAMQELIGFVVPANGAQFPPPEPAVFDRFGVRVACAVVPIAELPMLGEEIDREKLLELDRPGRRPSGHVAPRTPLERRLVAIWEEVLGVRRIGIHDTFFSLGGDSILAIQSVVRANAVNIPLTPAQLFEHGTIAAIAEAIGEMPAINAEQGIVHGPVPLTPAAHFFFEHELPVPDHFNQSPLFAVQAGLGADVLERALAHLVRHHDALRSRFVRIDGVWHHRIVPEEPHGLFRYVDVRGLADSTARDRVDAVAAEMHASLNLAEGPLVCGAFFDRGEDREGWLLLVIHHLVIDGFSWRLVLEDLHHACACLVQGEPVRLPEKTTSFKEWAERLAASVLSTDAAAEFVYWENALGGDMMRLPVDNPDGGNTERCVDNVTFELTPAETDALLHVIAPLHGAAMVEILTAGVACALGRWTSGGRLAIEIAHHGRAPLFDDINLARTVGWFSTFAPLALDLHACSDPGRMVAHVHERMAAMPGNGFGYGMLRYMNADAERRQRLAMVGRGDVLVSYLGQFDGTLDAASRFRPIAQNVGQMHHPDGRRMHLLVFNLLIVNGALHLALTYSRDTYHTETVFALGRDFKHALQELIAPTDAGHDVPGVRRAMSEFVGPEHVVQLRGG